jgi:hypothetical protein
MEQINCALETDGVSDGKRALRVCCFYHGFLEIQRGWKELDGDGIPELVHEFYV